MSIRHGTAGALRCVLGQDTLLSQCLCSPRGINKDPADCSDNLTEYLGVACDGLASHPGGLSILLVETGLKRRQLYGATWLKRFYFNAVPYSIPSLECLLFTKSVVHSPSFLLRTKKTIQHE